MGSHATYPLLPVRNTVIFPGFPVSLTIGRQRSVAALQRARARGGYLVVVAQRQASTGDPDAEDLYRVGTLSRIESVTGSDEQGFHVVIRGISRFKASEIELVEGALEAKGESWADRQDAEPARIAALMASLKELSAEILGLVPGETEGAAEYVRRIEDPVYLSHLVSSTLDVPIEAKQELLEQVSLRGRMDRLLELMRSQREALQIQREIREKMSERLSEEQREALLREQMRTIRDQLGESEDVVLEQLRKRVDDAGMPEDTLKIARNELRRLEQLPSASPETHVIRTYLEWLCDLPWKASEPGPIDLDLAERILDEDHYGLERVKTRVLQHLAVMKLKNRLRGPILLFVGPPGVGKTSLGQSIARALGREFVRVSLGGVRDDSEIRGHRRTYVGALPGRIIQGLRRAESRNPVFMLDEIDKLAVSFQGDPAAALLEVLDPAQNKDFTDHYLDVPFDLSDVFFIGTANSLETIPGPLLDRMETIAISGYTTLEKLHIARRYLLPRQLGENGLKPEQLELDDDAILHLAARYTREAGVRDLERRIGTLCRAAAARIVRGKGERVAADRAFIEEALGPERFEPETSARVTHPGVVTGLAWTPMGGEILFVEVAAMPGSGRFLLTGQLGDVMKESAQIAMSLVKANPVFQGLDFDFDKRDFHIHVPAGATPKDGPSAGVAILCAIASWVSRKIVDPRIALTGEITLRGAVLPVGGIKEKVIAAHRAGIRKVILPARNRKDLKEVPEDVRASLEFVAVETAAELLDRALEIRLNPEYLEPVASKSVA